MTVEAAPRWRPTWALRRAAALLLLLSAAALIMGRPGMALLALPLAVGTALAWADRTLTTQPRLAVLGTGMAEQGRGIRLRLQVTGTTGAQLTRLVMPRHRVGAPGAVVVAADQHQREIQLDVDTSRWGTHDPGQAAMQVLAPDALWVTDPVTVHVPSVRVLPAARPVTGAELPARAAGKVGAHRTRRPGDGSELLDVREFRPGDRIRRIDWRVSARRETLHVRHTAVDADADLVLCLDTRWDVGAQVDGFTRDSRDLPVVTSLHTAVEAAASLAATYLRLGDRVALVDLSVPARGVRPGAGQRQLMRIRWQLAGVRADRHLRLRAFREGIVPHGAVVVVLTPFLDRQIDEAITTLARTTADVIAIDVLPTAVTPRRDRRLQAATDLVLAERVERLAALRRRGVLVTTWDPALMALLLRRRQRGRR